MANIYQHVTVGALIFLASCGSQLTGPRTNTENEGSTSAGSTAPSAAQGSTSATGGADCGNANANPANGNSTAAGNSNVVAFDNIDPNAFKYGYYEFFNDPNTPAQAPTSAGVAVIFSDDPNACDSGTLVLHEGSPTFSSVDDLADHSLLKGPIAINGTASVGNGQCKLYGGATSKFSGNIVALTASPEDSNNAGFSYVFNVGTTRYSSGILPGKPCKFPFASNGLVSCSK